MAKEKNLLAPKGQGGSASGMGFPGGKPLQKGGKMRPSGLARKAKEVAEKVPTGPMKGLKF